VGPPPHRVPCPGGGVAASAKGNPVRYVFGVTFLIVGSAAFITGGRMALTGRNVTGLLGRGLTKADDLKLQRAPTSYFRALGSMLRSLGLLVLWVGMVFLTVGQGP